MNKYLRYMTKNKILYVDDEEDNLSVFNATFRRYYEILTATSGEEGLKIATDNDISVVITDQRMPELTGVDFLIELGKINPEPIKMLLTGYSDINAVIDAINRGNIYRYITKPWDKIDMKLNIDNAIETYLLKKENRKLIKNLQKINQSLESQVEERTAKITEQKEKIQLQAETLKKTNKEITEKNKKLIDLNKEKNHLMRIVAHDLKAPLVNIHSILHVLENSTRLPASQKKYIDLIYKVVDEGNQLIQDLLDISALEEYQTKMYPAKFDLIEFTQEIIEKHAEDAKRKSINIHFQKEPDNKVITSDKSFITRILDNLISNAIKFSHTFKNITISINGQNDRIRISVKDEGQGFTEEDMNYIYQKFQKLSARPTGGEHSSGLGLSIVKHLVDRLGGQINLITEQNVGSEFIITLPLVFQETYEHKT
jgi:two-component system, sensor histidine kinase and response regulator